MAGLNLLLALSFAAFCGISGLPAAPTTANPRLHCHVQKDLQYNTSNRPASNYNYPYDPLPLETLAEAICCDSYFSYFAEPVKFFAQPDVHLFESLNASTTTVFYDSACGIPLFRAPIGRSFETWRNESLTHGWPSFRTAEVFEGNVNITDNGEVVSKCGTHLGTNDPDELGTRYCLDLVCISGHGSDVMV